MALNLNQVILGGRLTAAPELKTTPNGISVLAFSIAVDRDYAKQGEEKQTDFINCVAWRQTAEFIAKYFGKGEAICVVGSLQTRTWQAQDGSKRYATEVIVDRAKFVESKASKGQAQAPSAPTAPVADEDDYDEVLNDGGVPF